MVAAILALFGAVGRFPRNTVACKRRGQGRGGLRPRRAGPASEGLLQFPGAEDGRAYVMGVCDGEMEAIVCL